MNTWLIKRLLFFKRIFIEFINNCLIQKKSQTMIYSYNGTNSLFKATIFYTLWGRILFASKAMIAFISNEKIFKKSFRLEGFDASSTDIETLYNKNYSVLYPKPPLAYDSGYILEDSLCRKIELSLQLADKIELKTFDKTDEWERISKLIEKHFFKDGKLLKDKLINFRADEELYKTIFNNGFWYMSKESGYKKSYFKAIDIILEYHRSAKGIDKCILASSSDSYAGNNNCIQYRGKRLNQRTIFHSQIVSDIVKKVHFYTNSKSVILDIGSSYGGLSRILKQYTPNSCHLLLDLPETLILTSYYIKYNFPKHNIALLDDIIDDLDNFDALIQEYDFIIIPPSVLMSLPKQSVDLVINSASLGFMQEQYIEYYLSEIDRVLNIGGYFYSLNKEYTDKWGKGFFDWDYRSKYTTHLFEFNNKFSYPQWLGQKVK